MHHQSDLRLTLCPLCALLFLVSDTHCGDQREGAKEAVSDKLAKPLIGETVAQYVCRYLVRRILHPHIRTPHIPSRLRDSVVPRF